ncbi:hypothetical protein WJX72_011431 [[Myrmecia] bisecta]|uniref:Amino acid transporter transmembrane domain-containing protein n=1 Tax=[Myrmecia] bisecta TaxID=41462 RepID=A0AAW1Q8C9_9CHLO
MDEEQGQSMGIKQPLLAAEPREGSLNIRVTAYGTADGSDTAAAEPLLSPAGRTRCSRAKAVFNLANTIIGAGMLALPKAYATLGVVAGTLTLLAICYMTYASLIVLIKAAEDSGRCSYAAIVGAKLGTACSAALRLAIILNCAGVIVIYMVVIADSLAGITEFAAMGPPAGPAPARTVIITVVAWLFVAPLVAPRTMRTLSHASLLSLSCACLFCGVTIALATAAACKGQLPHIHWLPDRQAFAGSPVRMIAQALAAVPVITTAFICHFNIHPVMAELKNYSHGRMRQVVQRSLGFCAATYIAVPVAAYMLFGDQTHGDVISNFTPAALGKLVAAPLAQALVLAVRSTNVLSLWLSMPMLMFPLRAEVFTLLKQGTQPSNTVFFGVTYVLLGLCYVLAVFVTSMWTAASLVGATSGIMLAFLFPALIMIRADPCRSCCSWRKLCAWGMFGLGCVLAVAGVASNFH